jgi:hypothetical protein
MKLGIFGDSYSDWTTTGYFNLDIKNFHQSSHAFNQMWEKYEK